MKKLFTSLLIAAFSVTCLGQTANNLKLRHQPLKGLLLKNDLSEISKRAANNANVLLHQWRLKSTLTYKQQLDSTISENKEYTEEWEKEGKDEFYYDNKGFCTHFISYVSTDNVEEYRYSSRYEFFSNDNISLSSIMLYDWNNDNASWEKNYKYEYTYYENELLKHYITFMWDADTETWIQFQKAAYIYNEKGQVFIETYSTHDSESEEWIDYARFESEYDSEWVNTACIGYVYDEDEDIWMALDKDEFTYNTDGFLLETISYKWNYETEAWENYQKEAFIYDAQKNLISDVVSYWDEDSNEWEPSWKDDFTYNNAYNLEDILVPLMFIIHYSDGGMSHMQLTSTYSDWDTDSESWIEKDRNTSYYSSTGTTNISNNRINVPDIYPNPAFSVINIQSSIFRQQSETIAVCDLNGRKLIEKQTPAGTETFQLNVSTLHSGAYLCKLISGNESVIKKLIIQK